MQDLRDNIKQSNIYIEENGEQTFEVIMDKNFPKQMKKNPTKSQFQDTYKNPSKVNTNKTRHSISKLLKIQDKEKIFKAAREMIQRNRVSANFFTQTM